MSSETFKNMFRVSEKKKEVFIATLSKYYL